MEIREIWEGLLKELGGDPLEAEAAAVIYECAANPVWPMEGMNRCIAGLRKKGLLLGIVSNAQFYTPLLFPALAGGTLETLGFDPDAMIFSYQMHEGKPSRRLYRVLSERLDSKGVLPQETVYVGNDRLKDIWPAHLEGFKTVFFAGDRRSRRWREDDERLGGIEPDAVVNHLDQLSDLIDEPR